MSSKLQSNPSLSPAATDTNWYPTEADLKTPKQVRAALQQVLKQHYELMDAHTKLQKVVATIPTTPPPANNGPTNTQLLGLPVVPIDTNSLANGATLKWSKATSSFIFS